MARDGGIMAHPAPAESGAPRPGGPGVAPATPPPGRATNSPHGVAGPPHGVAGARGGRHTGPEVNESVTLPLWVASAAGLLAVWVLVARLLLPGLRWLRRRRVDRVIDELNTRLQLQIPAFHRTKRQVLVERLSGDPETLAAVEDEARRSGLPREALIREARRYAREIVPSFNAWAYFRVAYVVARGLLRALYRVRLGYADDAALAAIEPDASVVFLMNHRSNVDYVLVAYMVASRSALSYAVGEWARVWPLQTLIRALGGFFVRRRSRSPLYRRVLAGYVQAATAGGVVQALYPEGGLTRDGSLQKPKLGLLSYMLAAFDPRRGRDLVFVPVGINYDRVLEDRSMVRALDPAARPRGRARALALLLRFLGGQVKLLLARRWYRFGYACVNFGAPVSMRAYTRRRGLDFRALAPHSRSAAVERLGEELSAAVAAAIPVLPVSLVATVFVREPRRELGLLEVKAKTQALIDHCERRGAYVHVARSDRDYAVAVGLRMLVLRRLVRESRGLYRASAGEGDLLRYYANSIRHFLRDEGPARRACGG